jgi:peptidoglycan/LPS O-acetylase OafA/YrhL
MGFSGNAGRGNLTTLLTKLQATNYYNELFKFVSIPYIILFISFSSITPLNKLSVFGDPSYGIYLYSFPVTQCTLFFLKNSIWNLAIILFVSITLGYISWFLIESKTLNLKKNEISK